MYQSHESYGNGNGVTSKKNASWIQSFATSHDDDMISKKLICMKNMWCKMCIFMSGTGDMWQQDIFSPSWYSGSPE